MGRRAAPLFGLLAVVTGCDGGMGSRDAGVADAGGDAAWPAPPAPPVFTPCPDGWREVSDPSGLVMCDPWPETGYRDDCAYDEAHFPGTPGCARVGTACPADGWPEGLPTDRAIVYVDDDAAPGGDGLTRATAYASLRDAVTLSPAGTLIAVATGRYDVTTGITLRSGTVLWGACVAETRLTSSVLADDAAAISLLAETGLRKLSLHAPARLGIFATGEGATLEDVVVAGARVAGVLVQGAVATLAARRLLVRDTQPGADGTVGYGVTVQTGARLVLERAVLKRNQGVGLIASGVGTIVEARDTVVRDTLANALGQWGSGLWAQEQAVLDVSRVGVDRSRFSGIASVSRATVTVIDALVSGVEQSSCTACTGDSGGFGLSAHFGGTLTVRNFTVRDAAVCGVVVGADSPSGETGLDLASGVIEHAPVGACVQVDGFDASRLRNMVEYRDVGVPLQATSYELPEALPGS